MSYTYPLRKCIDCEWLFIGERSDAKYCNECRSNRKHPRVCKIDELGATTSWNTLLLLTQFTLRSLREWNLRTRMERKVGDIVDLDIRREIRAERKRTYDFD